MLAVETVAINATALWSARATETALSWRTLRVSHTPLREEAATRAALGAERAVAVDLTERRETEVVHA